MRSRDAKLPDLNVSFLAFEVLRLRGGGASDVLFSELSFC